MMARLPVIVLGALLATTLTAVPSASGATVPEMEAALWAALRADRRADLEAAVARLQAADPASPALAHGLARLVGMGDHRRLYEAVSALNGAIAKHPSNLALKRARALLVVSAPWHRAAMADLQEVIAAEDPGAVALQAFVDAAARNDGTDLGEARITELLAKRQGRDPALLRARADIRYIRADLDGALDDLAAAVGLGAATLNDHLLRYRIHTKRGDDRAALADVDAMRAMLPADRGLMRMRAALLIRLGRSAEASQMLEEANRP